LRAEVKDVFKREYFISTMTPIFLKMRPQRKVLEKIFSTLTL